MKEGCKITTARRRRRRRRTERAFGVFGKSPKYPFLYFWVFTGIPQIKEYKIIRISVYVPLRRSILVIILMFFSTQVEKRTST